MSFGPDYSTSWTVVGGMGGRVESSRDLFETMEDVRSVAEDYGIDELDEEVELVGREGLYTIDAIEEMDKSFYDAIVDAELVYDLDDGSTIEFHYDKDILEDRAFINIWGDDELRTEVEDETGHLLYGTGWKRLFDVGRTVWRDI